MARAPISLLEWQVRKVRTRLFLQHLVNGLIVAWVAACAVFAAWWLARPYALGASAKPWMDYAVGGVALLISTVVAAVVAARRTPDPVRAALSLDERFQLRERVTTSLTLPPELRSTSAGRALMADVESKITQLDVGSRFPVRFGWQSVLVPAALAGLFLLAIFYDPVVNTAQGRDTAKATPLAPEVARELEQKKQEFLQKPKTDPKEEKRIKGEDAQKIEAQLQEILKRPMTTTDEVKDRLAEISKLEEEVKKKEKEEAEKVQAFKEQMQKLDRLTKKDKPKDGDDDKDGKNKQDDLRNALKDGDTEKAKKEADRLSKKLKNNEMDKKEQDHLKKETEDLKNDLEKLKRERQKEVDEKRQENEQKRQEKEKQLDQQRAENKLDKEEYDRQKKDLDQDRQKEQQQQQQEQKEMDQLAKKMEKCEQCLKDGDREGAAQALKDAADQLEEQEKKEQNLEDVQNELQRMQDLRESMAKACENPGPGRDGQEGDAETLNRRKDGDGKEDDGKDGKNGGKDGNKSGQSGSKSGQNKGGLGKGKGKRPDGKPIDTKSVDAKENARFDKTGAKIHVGTAGQAEKVIGKTGASLRGEIKQASQEAPDAVETQRIPPGYKDSTKGYFKNIGNQKTGENVPMK